MPTAWIIAASLAAAQPVEAKPAVPEVQSGRIEHWSGEAIANDVGVDDIWIWLPPSYGSDPDKRYPVLYMHDGQNLFDRRLTNFDKEWGVDEAIAGMAARGDLREWIVVGLRSPRDRYLALFPEKLFDYLPEGHLVGLENVTPEDGIRREQLLGDEYLAFLVDRIKPKVDATYATLPSMADTAVMGSSMGGLMSLYAMAEYSGVFGQAAAVSIHYPLGNPEVEDVPSHVAASTQAWSAYLDTRGMRPGENHLYMDHGTGTLDAYYPPYAESFDRMMLARGWGPTNYESRRFSNADHDERAWRERIDIPLGFLDRQDP